MDPSTPFGEGDVFLQDETGGWTEVGRLAAVDFDDQSAGDGEPFLNGSLVLPQTSTIEIPFTANPRGLIGPWEHLLAAVLARQVEAITRLADDLGDPWFLTRDRFQRVQQVLEAAGIGDGYGRLTIPQPARPPVPPVPAPTAWRRP